MSIGLKRDRLLHDDRGAAIASATAYLQLEAAGLSACMPRLPPTHRQLRRSG
jgi:hypothetical protein